MSVSARGSRVLQTSELSGLGRELQLWLCGRFNSTGRSFPDTQFAHDLRAAQFRCLKNQSPKHLNCGKPNRNFVGPSHENLLGADE